MINLNTLAKEITAKEGKVKSLSIAQIKEVMKIMLEELAQEDVIDVLRLLKRYK